MWSLALNLILGTNSKPCGDYGKNCSLFRTNKTGVPCSRCLVPKITQAFGQTCLLTPGLPALSDYHLPHPSFSLSSALSDLAYPQSWQEERKERSSSVFPRQSDPVSGSWDGGWVLKYLFSYLHPFLCKDPRDGPTLSCVGGQSIHMSNHVFCDTPGPATHCSDPSILISRS